MILIPGNLYRLNPTKDVNNFKIWNQTYKFSEDIEDSITLIKNKKHYLLFMRRIELSYSEKLLKFGINSTFNVFLYKNKLILIGLCDNRIIKL